MEKSAERLREMGLEPLTKWRAEPGKYERWLASEGVRVVFCWGERSLTPEEVARDATSVHVEIPWVPPWVNLLGESLRGQRLVDAVRRAVRDDPLGDAIAGAFALGEQRAVEELLLGAEGRRR